MLCEGFGDCEIVDLSHILEEGLPDVQLPFAHIVFKSARKGDDWNTNMVLFFEHHGTHIDAPSHLAVGKQWVHEIPLTNCMGPCCVIDLRSKKDNELTTKEDLVQWERRNGTISKGDIILLNYGWDRFWQESIPCTIDRRPPYVVNFPGLAEEGAEFLLEKGVKAVGCDTPGLDSYELTWVTKKEASHIVLLPKNIPIVENLTNLDRLPPKGAFFMALPLGIKDGSGSPTRAIAIIRRR